MKEVSIAKEIALQVYKCFFFFLKKKKKKKPLNKVSTAN